MQSSERPQPATSGDRLSGPEREIPKPVVRVIAVAPIATDELAHTLKAGYSVDDFFLSEVVLSQKSELSEPSPGMLEAVGGDRHPDETVHQATLREVGEETMFVATSLLSSRRTSDIPTTQIEPFIYRIPKRKAPRLAQLVVLPIRSRSFSSHVPREGTNGEVDKIERILSVTPLEFESLVEAGTLARYGTRLTIQGHLTKSDSEIKISPAEKQKKDKALDQVVGEVYAYESRLRDETLKHINRVRLFKHQHPASTLQTCSRDEIIRGFVAAQMAMDMGDERVRERQQKDGIGANNDLPPHNTDYLTARQFLVGIAADRMPELLLSTPTRTALHAVNSFKRALRRTLPTIYEEMGKSLDPETLTSLSATNPYEAIVRIWPEVLALPPDKNASIVAKIDDLYVRELAKILHVSRGAVAHALEVAHGYPQYITEALKNQIPQHQQHRSMNEIANARMFTLLLYAMELHPNLAINPDDRPQVVRILREQSLRVLANFATALESLAHNKHADNSLFEAALDSFLKFPPQPEIMELTVEAGGKKEIIPHQVYHRETMFQVAGRRLHLIVDERQKKTVESEMTKRYLSNTRKPHGVSAKDDTFAVNFVIANDNYKDGASVEERLVEAEALRETWLKHLRTLYESRGYAVRIVVDEGDLGYGNVRSFLALPVLDQYPHVKSLMKGDRPGSRGGLIIREQLRIHIEGHGKHQVTEFDIYPFEDMESGEVSTALRYSGLWDFRKKIEDDARGLYVANRIYQRNLRRPIAPSLYELLWPPHLYEWLIIRIMREQIVPRKRWWGWPFG